MESSSGRAKRAAREAEAAFKTKYPNLGAESETFVKHDEGKPRTDLLDPEFLLLLAKVMEFGARKYGDNNWKKCTNPNRYYAAALRHLLSANNPEREPNDEESELPHYVHTAVCCMMAWRLAQ